MLPAMMKRRDALKTIGGLGAAASMARFLPGCGGDDGPVGIKTIVYMMMENRSYDHLLGGRAFEGLPGDGQRQGFANPDTLGNSIAAFPASDDHNAAASSTCDPDPPHGWDPSHASFNSGAMDGFVKAHQADHSNNALIEPMKYLTRANVPVTWALADQYTVCDRWFCSVMGPTLPNRAYWHTATSFGIDNNSDILSKLSTGVPVPTIYNRLDEKGVDWAYYYGSLPVVSLLGSPGPYQLDLGPDDGTGRVRRFGDSKASNGQFFEDAAAGKLPSVVYIDPAFGTNDDHPPTHPILGQELIASVYMALAKSPQWNNILFVVTYDEHGGYFDHVPPPTTSDDTLAKFGKPGFEQLGFRVPALVMGPYAKQRYVSSVQYNHASALKHLQNQFNLNGLTARMDAAVDLTDCIDQDRLKRGDPAPPIELPAFNSDEWPFHDMACKPPPGGIFLQADDPISAWADANPDAFKGYDARGDKDEYLKGIHSFCVKNGLYK
jgi:phospholipase C